MSMSVGPKAVFVSLACYLAYSWCALNFLKRHLEGNMAEGTIFGGLLFGGHVLMTMFLENEKVPYILYALCSHVLLMGLTMAVFGGRWEKKLLAAVILETMTRLIWNFCESFLCCIGLIAICAATGNRQMTFMGTWVGRIILLATYGAGIAALHLLSGPLSPIFHHKKNTWYLYMAVPLGGIILVMDLVNWGASNGIMVQEWGKYGLYENQLFSHGAMCIFTGLAMAAAGFFVFGMDKIHREEKAGEQYRCQAEYYQMLEKQYSQMERLRHDMKNHMIVLANLVHSRQWEQADAYLRDMTEAGGVEAGEEATGSPVIDALLSQKRRQALERGIRWQCDARVPQNSPIRELDLCIIAGNILDNALEACERLPQKQEGTDPFIEVHMGTVKRCFFLEVQNRTHRTNSPKKGESGKADPKGHGLGLSNIRAAAEGYNGAVHTKVEEGVFVISVLLPLYEAPLTSPAPLMTSKNPYKP